MEARKSTEFLGTSLDDLRAFPTEARREAGFQLDRVQAGLLPTDWKPMKSIGQGVQEIRIQDAAGQFRIIYVARFAGVVYVLHCFQKKEQKTSIKDLRIATDRYSALLKEIRR